MTKPTALSPRLLLAVAVAVAASAAFSARTAHADSDVVIVAGKADAHQQTVIGAAVTAALRQGQWAVIDLPFSPRELATIEGCLVADRPWSCIAPTATAKGVSRLVIIQANPEAGSGQTKLVGQLILAADRVPPIEQQYCGPCTDNALAQAATELATRLLADSVARTGATALDIRTVPPGAGVTIDGTLVGETNKQFPISAGHHKILLQRTGYQSAIRDIDVATGENVTINETLVAVAGGPPGGGDDPGRPHLVPGIVVGAGVVALVAGIAVQATADGPPLGQVQPTRIYSAPGIGLMVGGGVAVGVGVYLWARASRNAVPASSPTVTLLHGGGGIIGWSDSF